MNLQPRLPPVIRWKPSAATSSASGRGTPKEYAQAVRELQNGLKGRPLETSPEYAALQARLPGNRQAAQAPALETRNGQAFRGGERTATGYRAAMTGERARSWHGNPAPDAFGGFATAAELGGQA